MFKKIFYINLFGITLLALFNYLVFHNLNSKAYLKSFMTYQQKITNLTFQSIDRQIMEAASEIPQLYFSNIRQNDDLLFPQEKDVIGSPSDIRGLTEKMEEIRKAYPYVASMDVYYEGTGTVVTGFSNVHRVADEQGVRKYLPWYDGYEACERNDVFLEAPQQIYPTGQQVITYVKRISLSKWKEKGIIVAIHISPNSFQEFIDETAGTLVILSPVYHILYVTSREPPEVTEKVMENLEKEKGKQGHFPELMTVRIREEDMTLFCSSVGKTNLKYVYYVQNSTFYADYNVRNRIFFLNFLLSIVYNLLILVAFSFFNHDVYKRQVVKASMQAGIDVKESKGSFTTSLDTLTKEISTLNEAAKSSQTLMFQNEVRTLILNRKNDGSYERLTRQGAYSGVCVVICYPQDISRASHMAAELQRESLEESYGSLFTTMERGVVGILMADKKDISVAAADFTDRVKCLEAGYRIAVGEVLDLTRDNIGNSYRSACETARYRFIYRDRQILTHEDMNIGNRKETGSHRKLFENLEKDINRDDFEGVRYHMEALRVSFQEGGYTIDYCLSTLRDLVSFLYQIMEQKQLDMWIVLGYDIRTYYGQIQDIQEFEAWGLDVCRLLLENIRQKKRGVDADMKKKLTDLIGENLENDISLDFLSDCLSVRPDVLSRQFRQVMGKGYTEYIKEKKMERALELLKEDCSMNEIARRLGYSSSQYFIKVFKEVKGETPFQYKKSKIRIAEEESEEE